MDFNFQLTQDFIFLMELCKDPENVFQRGSNESCIASSWLEKLSRYECRTLAERRLRNVYMSHLCACLNLGQLKGPFLRPARDGPLNPANFESEQTICDGCTSIDTVRCEKSSCSCLPQIQSGDEISIMDTSETPEPQFEKRARNDACKIPPRKGCFICVPRRKKECKERPDGNVCCNYFTQQLDTPFCLHNYDRDFAAPGSNKCDICDKPIPSANFDAFNCDIRFLLTAITSELRGECEPHSCAYLEHELMRYKSFIKKHSQLACVLDKQNSVAQLRTFLLVNLQNDLIKLLSEKV